MIAMALRKLQLAIWGLLRFYNTARAPGDAYTAGKAR
jgi:hypothetical protein